MVKCQWMWQKQQDLAWRPQITSYDWHRVGHGDGTEQRTLYSITRYYLPTYTFHYTKYVRTVHAHRPSPRSYERYDSLQAQGADRAWPRRATRLMARARRGRTRLNLTAPCGEPRDSNHSPGKPRTRTCIALATPRLLVSDGPSNPQSQSHNPQIPKQKHPSGGDTSLDGEPLVAEMFHCTGAG